MAGESEERICRNCVISDFVETVDSDLEGPFAFWWAYLDKERSREHNVTGPLHLVSLDRPIHALARRAVVFSDPTIPEQIGVSQYAKVSQYHQALILLCDRVYAAMQARTLTPRDDLLGAPILFPQAPDFKCWRRLDRAVQNEDWSTATELLSGPFAAVTDRLFPALMVNVVEFSAWAVADGIAEAGEVERLLRKDATANDHSSKPRLRGHQRSGTGAQKVDEIWKTTAKQYADEIYRRDKAIGCDPSKSDLATQIARRFSEEGISGARVRLSPETIVRHGLKGWQKPV
jgi:hypothetical protein